jgi:hypothetical protein
MLPNKVSAELYGPLESLFSMKDKAFSDERVIELRGVGINADRVIRDIQQYISRSE